MSDPLETFIEHWSKAEASERANSQPFLCGLADLLAVPRPSNTHHDGYSFEYPIKIPRGDGTTTQGFLDLYRRGCFVLESKQFVAPNEEQTPLQLLAEEAGIYTTKKKTGPVRGSEAWDEAMFKARGQAERYARSLPAEEPSPPFLLIVDVGHTIEIFADFTQAGKAYLPFPDPRGFRIRLADLRDDKIRERLRLIWLDPLSLDPAKHSAAVTKQIAEYLATLAKSLEEAGHAPRLVAEFLTRCLFCMFAEDVGLLPKDGFRTLLESLRGAPDGFVPKLRTLFAEMQTGTDFSVILNRKLLRFNGGLFEDASVLPVDGAQLGILILASKQEWKEVEPAIFGTLLERALDPDERHQLGAHYTPRAYVERLVLPTVIEPLRAEWESVRAAVVTLVKRAESKRISAAEKGKIVSEGSGAIIGKGEGIKQIDVEVSKLQRSADEDEKEALSTLIRFHTYLCEIRVLDPACGSGNFLYVTLEHLKRLEGEVLDTATGFGETILLDLSTHTVDPHQFLGIELNPRAASVAEMVLWIGYLQWHFRTRGQTMPEEPVLKKFRNIECRDAVLAWDGEPQPQRDERGEIITVWDRRSEKTDLVTGRDVPDESKRVPLLTYPNAHPAEWPKADYIVGNPPFIGARTIRPSVGDGYLSALRSAYPRVADNVDFVMYWWEKAALLVRNGQTKRFGFITTNSFTQSFNRSVVERHMREVAPLGIIFAVSDHPWVDTIDGAAVRIAMTVGEANRPSGTLFEIARETAGGADGAVIEFTVSNGVIEPNLTIGQDTGKSVELKANEGICCVGYQLTGTGFAITKEQARSLLASESAPAVDFVSPLLSARDITQEPRDLCAIDLCSFRKAEEVMRMFPTLYQWVLNHVKPERDSNPRSSLRERWWIYGEPRNTFRPAIHDLHRIIVTPLTSKHRMFVFAKPNTIADSTTVIFAFDDAFYLGVLSSRVHVVFSLAAGGTLEDRPRYNKSECLDPFPFPVCEEAAKTRIRALGEELDAHRKRVQAQHPGLSLTAMYNVLEDLCAGRALTAKEQTIHDNGLVSVLRQLHDELDTEVFMAYGWNDLAHAVATLRHGEALDLKTGMNIQLSPTADGIQAAIAHQERLIDAEILTRLVALNAERAAEEAAGTIRWLRPDYQNPTGTSATQGGLALKKGKEPKAKVSKAKTKWPKTLAERVGAVDTALQATTGPVTAELLAKRFARAKPEDIAEILETLATLGRAHRDGENYTK